MPTIATIPLLILFAILWRCTGGKILAMVAFVSVFTAASALNFGSLGVAPWLFVLALGLVLKLILGHAAYKITPDVNRAALAALVLFVVYACWTGFAYPLLFAGVPIVRTVAEEPLTWGMSNVAQLCYLVAVSVLYFMVLGCSRRDLREILAWYVRGCTVAALFAFYQLLNATTHIPYPSAVLYSNKAHVVYPAYMIGGMWRLNSTFCEASEMAGYLAVGLVLTGWSLVTKGFKFGRMAAALLMLVALLMTMSSVGYLCLGYMICCGSVLIVRHVIRQGGMAIPTMVSVLLLVLAGTTFFLTVPSAGATVDKVIRSTLIDKQNSDSYKNRTLTHSAALSTLDKTSYLGAGWGSARASGLVYVLLATIGLPGLLLFAVFLVTLTLPLFKPHPMRLPSQTRYLPQPGDQLAPALFSLSILLLAMLIAGAEPVDPMLWILFGVASAGRARHPQRAAHAFAPHTGPMPATLAA